METKDVFRQVATDTRRTAAIADEVADAFSRGRKVLVLTERTGHIAAIEEALAGRIEKTFTLHGRMPKKLRNLVTTELDGLPADAPRVLLATGKLVGEGFDHPPLDTLVLAMPISWNGTLQKYAGCLHREHSTKVDVRIIDFVDTAQAGLLRMWDKRQAGYRAMGYSVESPGRTK
jgi:superfamily II DNA or RNA helicase